MRACGRVYVCVRHLMIHSNLLFIYRYHLLGYPFIITTRFIMCLTDNANSCADNAEDATFNDNAV